MTITKNVKKQLGRLSSPRFHPVYPHRDPGMQIETMGALTPLPSQLVCFPPQYELPIMLGIVLMLLGEHFCYGKSCKKMLAMFLRKQQILLIGECVNTVLLDSTKLCYIHLPCSIFPGQF